MKVNIMIARVMLSGISFILTSSTPGGIRTRDLQFEGLVAWTAGLTEHVSAGASRNPRSARISCISSR